jgi:hypothetical protein
MLASTEAKGLAEHDHGLQNRYGFFGSTKTVGFNLIFLIFLKKYKPENLVINQKPVGLSFSFKILILNKNRTIN